MYMSNQRRVMPRGDGRWEVKKDGNDRASSVHDTQAQAIEKGREQARANKEEFAIHNRQNQIRSKDSYGPDPRSSKG